MMPELVCVTGAGGFIGSWIVKHLLDRGYHVKSVVRDPDDPKNEHLIKLDGAKERMSLVKSDILDYSNIFNIISGCDGVFHTACPVVKDRHFKECEIQLIDPAVKGTLNVLKAACESGVRRVILTSSMGAVYMDPNRPIDSVVDENCWSDVEYLRNKKSWYCLAKTLAERAAWQFSNDHNLDMVSICPSIVLGPMLQATLNASNAHVMKYFTGTVHTFVNQVQAYVDVRDVAEAHILAFETMFASGRYICFEQMLHREDLVNLLYQMGPQYPIPRRCSDELNPRCQPFKLLNMKLEELGKTNFVSITKCLEDTINSFKEKGFLK